MNQSKKRAVLIVDLYVYGNNDKDLIAEAKKVIKRLNELADCNASAISLVEHNFGEKKGLEIKILADNVN